MDHERDGQGDSPIGQEKFDLGWRLENASGPDRELDAQIALAMDMVPSEGARPCAAVDVGTFGVGGYGFWTSPAFTESIDAALTLVPDGVDWGCGSRVGLRSDAYIKYPDLSTFTADDYASPAIALCIAALRARGF